MNPLIGRTCAFSWLPEDAFVSPHYRGPDRQQLLDPDKLGRFQAEMGEAVMAQTLAAAVQRIAIIVSVNNPIAYAWTLLLLLEGGKLIWMPYDRVTVE